MAERPFIKQTSIIDEGINLGLEILEDISRNSDDSSVREKLANMRLLIFRSTKGSHLALYYFLQKTINGFRESVKPNGNNSGVSFFTEALKFKGIIENDRSLRNLCNNQKFRSILNLLTNNN